MRFLKRKLYFLRLFCLNSYIFVLRLFFLFVSTALIWNCIGVNSKQNYAKLLLSFPKCQKELDIALFFFKRTECFRGEEVWQGTKGRVIFKGSCQIMFFDDSHVWEYQYHIRGNMTIKDTFFPNLLHSCLCIWV